MNLTQIGLGLDIVGFAIIFFVGGLSFGVTYLVTEDSNRRYVLPARILGFALIIGGFMLQIWGASS